jgi:hypothetical protein
MADFVLKDAFVHINGVDLSDHVESVTLNYDADMQDNSAMGDTTHSFLPGLLVKSFTANFYQDFAASSVDATLFPLVGAAAFPVRLRASKTGAISATNPEYQGNFIVESYPIFGNSVGEMAMAAVTFRSGDGAALVRDITP